MLGFEACTKDTKSSFLYKIQKNYKKIDILNVITF